MTTRAVAAAVMGNDRRRLISISSVVAANSATTNIVSDWDGTVYEGDSSSVPHRPSSPLRVPEPLRSTSEGTLVDSVNRSNVQTGEGKILPIETTLLRVVVGFRVVSACWLTALAVITVATEPAAIDRSTRSAIVISAIAVAIVWTVVTVFLAYRRPETLANPVFLVIDLVLAAWVGATPGLVESGVFFAGGYPISSPFLIATTRGIITTIAPAMIISASSAVGVLTAGARAAEVIAINLISPLVVAWGFGTIRRQDSRRRQAEEALADEQTKLAIANERAETAAHLHDSVLQTLALIQRKDPMNREVVRLARRQERELRAWLNGGAAPGSAHALSGAVIRAAEEVEDEYDVMIQVSTVGDTLLDDRISAVVLAAGEAMKNAARFAGVDRIFVLSEADEDGVRVVIRDQGVGFDPADVPPGRRGMRESISGRMERLGGIAEIRSRPGEGTEVELRITENES